MDDTFTGRSEEIAVLDALLRARRVVTIVGPGGIGKTSLATKAIAGARDGVDLVPVRSREDLVERLASTLAIGRAGAADAGVEDLLSSLSRSGEALVFLDNAEHVIAEVAWFVELALQRTQIRFLVTSRKALGLKDEAVFALEPMPHADGLALLQARLGRHGVSFVEDDENVHAIARHADGVPLAIELLASQARLLPLAKIRADLERHVLSASTPWADSSPRHRSIGSALESSWALLEEEDRRRVHDLCVFGSVFTIEDAERIWKGDDVLAVLARLHASSFLVVDRARERWRILQPMRDFLLHRLGPPDAAVRLAHALAFREKAASFARDLWTSACIETTRWLEAQLFDCLAAFDVLRDAGRIDDAIGLACDLDEFIAVRGPSSLTLRLLGEASLLSKAAPESRARAALCRGRSWVLAGKRKEAEQSLSEAEAFFADAPSSPLHVRSRLWRALDRYWFSEIEEARRLLEDTTNMADPAASPADAAFALLYLGIVTGEEGRRSEAEALFARAARIIEAHGITLLRPRLVVYRLYFLRDRMPSSQMAELLRDALAVTEAAHDFRFSAAALTSLGDLAFLDRDPARAIEYYDRAEARYAEVGFSTAVPMVRFSSALARWQGGDLDGGRRVLGELALDWGKPSPNAWFARTALAGLYADTGDSALAQTSFADCETSKPDGLTAARFLALFQLLSAKDIDRALREADAATAYVHETPGSSSELLLAQLLIATRLRARVKPDALPAIAIAPDGSWFEVVGEPRVPMGRKPSLRRLLLALAARGPDAWLTAEEAFAAGWPGEKGIGRSASYRVYSAVKRLRALGLGGALETGPGGYCLRRRASP